MTTLKVTAGRTGLDARVQLDGVVQKDVAALYLSMTPNDVNRVTLEYLVMPEVEVDVEVKRRVEVAGVVAYRGFTYRRAGSGETLRAALSSWVENISDGLESDDAE